MMQSKRLSVKFFIDDPEGIDLAQFMEVFQRWIQHQRVEGLLIDVVDYHHVYQGPGVILIGDEGDYALDNSEGRPGLLYIRKRQMPDSLVAALRECVRLAVIACQFLEMERPLKGRSFDYSHLQTAFLDRLAVPNNAGSFTALKSDTEAFAAALYDGASVELRQVDNDSRQPLTIRIQSSVPVDGATLQERLKSGQVVS